IQIRQKYNRSPKNRPEYPVNLYGHSCEIEDEDPASV
ncbi:unnamed protein product, partial [marine sediment metagenome]